MKNVLLFVFPALVLLACNKQNEQKSQIKTLSTTSHEAMSPYLTTDDGGRAVLCWTEKDPVDSVFRLKYAFFDSDSNQFKPVITVAGSEGAQTGPEAMNKVAFKSDGTVIAVFGKKFANEKNPYAGAIYYSISKNKGKSWSSPQFLHSDTAHTYGRSFFDVVRLRNGEIGAVWLDGRLGKAEKGSAIFFASTAKGEGFGRDRMIDRSTCECCRTELLADGNGDIHLAYRKVLFPEKMMGKQVRDMVYSFSTDNGQTFSPAQPISNDNWAIEGCPHTGPSLAMTGKTVNALWFTAGGSSGVYFSQANNGRFSHRRLLSEAGRHPQMLSLADSRLVTVWEEGPGDHPMGSGAPTGQHAAMMHHEQDGPSGIVIDLLEDGQKSKTIFRSSGEGAEHHAVITSVGNKLLAVWVSEQGGHSGIKYSMIPLTE